MTEFGGDLVKFNKKHKVFSKGMFDLLENSVNSENYIATYDQEMTGIRQKLLLIGEHMTEMIEHMTKIKQGRSIPTSQAPCYAPIHVDSVKIPRSTTIVHHTSQPAELLQKLENTSSEEERRRKLLHGKVIYPATLKVFLV